VEGEVEEAVLDAFELLKILTTLLILNRSII
jgi:hypothetical protein